LTAGNYSFIITLFFKVLCILVNKEET